MPITYEQTADKEIHDRVRRKHAAIIHELKALNFQEFYFFGETVGTLGFSPLGCSGFFGMLVALFHEVTKIERNLGITLFNVVMGFRDYATYAGPFGMGVKFYTGFTDGTCVITANFNTPAIQDDQEKLYKFALAQPVAAAWSTHKNWVDKLCSDGKQKSEPLSFAGYLKLVQREDDYMVKRQSSMVMDI
jgi:hypothetical protein